MDPIDKFVQLSQEDKIKELLEEAESQPTEDVTDQPATTEPAKPEEGKPAEFGDFGTALKNIEDVGRSEVLTKGKEAALGATEPDLGFGQKTGMEKLKSLPGEIGKAIIRPFAAMLPTSIGEAALFGGAGRVTGKAIEGVKAAGKAFHAEPPLPKISEVKENISVRSSGESEKAPDQFGTAKKPEPEPIKETPKEPEQPQLDFGTEPTEKKSDVLTGMEQIKDWEQKLLEKRKELGSRIVTPNDVSRALGRELFPNEIVALNAPGMQDGASYVFGLTNQSEFAEAHLLSSIERFRGGDLSAEENIQHQFDTVLTLTAKIKNGLEELARGLQTGREEDVQHFTKRWLTVRAKAEEAQRAEAAKEEVKPLEEKLTPDLIGPEKKPHEVKLYKFELSSEEMPGLFPKSEVKPIPKTSPLFIGPKQPRTVQTQQKLPLSGAQITRILDSIGKKREIKVAENSEKTGYEWFTSHLYFSTLSNPRTWEVNFGVPAFLMPFYESASIALGSRLTPKLLSQDAAEAGELARYHPGAAQAHLVGAFDGLLTGIREINRNWQKGGIRRLLTDLRDLEPLPRSSLESASPKNTGPSATTKKLNEFLANHEKLSWMTFDPQGVFKPLAQFLDSYGEVMHMGRQIMEGSDKLAYMINEHAHRGSQAFSRGVELGLTGKALERFYKTQLQEPTLLSQIAAHKGGMHDIFREEITGSAGQIIGGMGHPLWRPIVMFARTPFNLASVGLEAFPGVNRFVTAIREDYAAGGARAQLATGRWMTAQLVTGMFASAAMIGRFNGYGPNEPKEREAWLQSNEPYALKIRDTGDKQRDFVSLKFMSPFIQWLGPVADMIQMRAWEEQPKTALEYMWAPVVSLWHAFGQSIFTEDLFKFINALHPEPDESMEQWARKVEKYAEQRAASFLIPGGAGLRALYSVYDPITKEITSMSDRLKASIPGWSSTLKPDLDWLGNEQRRGGEYNLLMLPVREASSKYDKVNNEVARNHPSLLTLPTILDGKETTSEDKYRFKLMRGKTVKLFNGKNMGDALLELVNSEQYQKATAGPHGMRSQLLSAYVSAYTKKATAELGKKDPRYFNLLREFEHADALTGRTVERPGFLKIQPE